LFFKVEFLSELCREIQQKLTDDIPLLVGDDSMFWHTLNETLLFEKTIQINYLHEQIPEFPHPITIFVTNYTYFTKWLQLELQCIVTFQIHLCNILIIRKDTQ
jgi:hypothetical protein